MFSSSSSPSSKSSSAVAVVVGLTFGFAAAFATAATATAAIEVVDIDIAAVGSSSSDGAIDSSDPNLRLSSNPPISSAVTFSNGDIASGSGFGLASSMSIWKTLTFSSEALCRTKCSQRVAVGSCCWFWVGCWKVGDDVEFLCCCCCWSVNDVRLLLVLAAGWRLLEAEEPVVLSLSLHDIAGGCLCRRA